LRDWARPYYSEVRAFIDGCGRDELSAELNMPWAERLSRRFGPVGPSTLAETLLQVVMHSSYHRGQVATRIRELGGDPPLTDFIAWVWQRKPNPAW
jgi:uncharacterized damage-inducible protein DinB